MRGEVRRGGARWVVVRRGEARAADAQRCELHLLWIPVSHERTFASLWMCERDGQAETTPASHRAAMAAARLRKAKGERVLRGVRG